MKRLILAGMMVLMCVGAWANVDWSLLTGNAAFSPRVFASSAVFDGRVWIIGGANSIYNTTAFYNDVWYTYNGIDWFAATRNAEWSPRMRQTTFVYNNKMWVVAGQEFTGAWLKDVWYSTDGIDWIAATRNAAFGTRNGQCQTNMIFDGKMWIISGQGQAPDPTGVQRDVWYSTDGIDWICATKNAEFDARSGFSGAVYNGKMWIGGGASGGGEDCSYLWYSSNGIFWTEATGTMDPARHSIQHLSIFSFSGYLWVLGGSYSGADIPAYDNVQRTTDGNTWITETNGFGPHAAANVEIYGNFIILMAGSAADNAPTPVVMNSAWFGAFTDLSETITPTFTRTATVTKTATRTVTRTRTPTATVTPTRTVSPTRTTIDTKTFTPTRTPTFIASATGTFTDTITATWTISETVTLTPTFTVTPTATVIETISLWLAQNAGYGAPNDTTVAWRQYPDTIGNTVNYTLYISNVTRNQPNRIIAVPNIDDLDASIAVFGYVIQGLTGGDCYSVTVTAEGGDLGVSFMSNNIQICPEIRTQLDARIQGTNGETITPYETGFIMWDAMHVKKETCETVSFQYYKEIGANGFDYIGIANPNSNWHWKAKIITANGIGWITPYSGAVIGAAGTTSTAFFFGNCTPIPTPPVVYNSSNTTNAGAQMAEAIIAGGSDSTNPTGSKGGSVGTSEADWFKTYGNNTFYVKVNAGATSTKTWVILEAYMP